MYEVSQRIERAAESILENERLTADLDDAAAQVLIDWGLACAELIAGSTDGKKVTPRRRRSYHPVHAPPDA
jgi:hypothetical protein